MVIRHLGSTRMTRFQFVAVQICILIFAFTTAWADFDLKVFDGRGKQRDIESVVTDLSAARAVFIGESHDRYDQHLSELEIIRRLYERDPNRWAIGVEFIQRPFQSVLDAYIAGDISEREFLKKTEYFDRWGYDFRLYRPIFRFSKDHAIPMVALNADRELTERVGEVGLEGLSGTERERLPGQIDKSDDDYRERIQKIFKEHTQARGGDFEHFWEAQLVWDETMAERVTEYLSTHPEKAMVVLAGAGHMEYGSGIPNRVRRRMLQLRMALLITNDKPLTKSHLTDYSLVSKREVLPSAPRMGITTDVSDGGVRVKSVTPGGPAFKSGIKPKDRIVAINDEEVKSPGDVSLALLDKKAGDPVVMRVQRGGAAGTENLTFEMRL
jgi:uncharacterized iron-regulated protein